MRKFTFMMLLFVAACSKKNDVTNVAPTPAATVSINKAEKVYYSGKYELRLAVKMTGTETLQKVTMMVSSNIDVPIKEGEQYIYLPQYGSMDKISGFFRMQTKSGAYADSPAFTFTY